MNRLITKPARWRSGAVILAVLAPLLAIGGVQASTASACSLQKVTNVQSHFLMGPGYTDPRLKITWTYPNTCIKFVEMTVHKQGSPYTNDPYYQITPPDNAQAVKVTDLPYPNDDGAYVVKLQADYTASVYETTKYYLGATKGQGSGVNAKLYPTKAKNKGNSCLDQGLAAADVAVASGGIIAAFSAWIPGVDVVTGTGLAAATAAAGGASYIQCVLPW